MCPAGRWMECGGCKVAGFGRDATCADNWLSSIGPDPLIAGLYLNTRPALPHIPPTPACPCSTPCPPHAVPATAEGWKEPVRISARAGSAEGQGLERRSMREPAAPLFSSFGSLPGTWMHAGAVPTQQHQPEGIGHPALALLASG